MQQKKSLSKSTFWANIYVDELNNRIRVDDFRGEITSIMRCLEEEFSSPKFEKFIMKARMENLNELISAGFTLEAVIDRYFNGSNAYLMAKYRGDDRRNSKNWVKEEYILEQVLKEERQFGFHSEKPGITMRMAEKVDAPLLASLYRKVFAVYPVPIHEASYISKSMDEGSIFYCIEKDGQIISAASAEISMINHNAELTDCATLPDFRKGGLMKDLLLALEEELRKRRIFCCYTIARSLSFGMNMAFYQLGYEYRGRLVNNCYIYDKLEDMNVWVKDLSTAEKSALT
ncbi:putative beta-lysine N-acetyltransferase [Falsibacillus albus]|uniref:Putative beta-lysine N-acetyltransferase n=1 Tax=Falsibacillus albus TaxID=2478915 RepID=A0A3L7JYL0_9BACI|nr:putative beta-lysine N-acetyltransferase [Falsibacillus albus]RLQ95199.1 putative beta-lysine N-acetyltransferase [Falsibacillus albus]